MNQIYPTMSASDLFNHYLGQIKIPRLLDFGIRARAFLHLQWIRPGTGFISHFNRKLKLILIELERKETKIIAKANTETDYNDFRSNIFTPFGKLYAGVSAWKGVDETKIIAENIMDRLYDIDFAMRKKVFSKDYRPNHEADKPLKSFASKVSLTSASHLLHKDVLPG